MKKENNPEQPQESPQELNSQLNKFFELIPIYDLGESRSAMKGSVQHKFSEEDRDYHSVYWDKLKLLLEKADISPEFRERILINLYYGRQIGISKQFYDKEIQNEYYFLDFDDSSGGIFDKNKVISLERKAIAREVVDLTYHQEILKILLEDWMPEEEKEKTINAKKEYIERQKETINSWIQNFKKIYGENIIS